MKCSELVTALNELKAVKDLNRWRKWPDEKPIHGHYCIIARAKLKTDNFIEEPSYITVSKYDNYLWNKNVNTQYEVTNWRPITPPTV